MVGKDAAAIAGKAGVRVPGRIRVLLAPFELAVGRTLRHRAAQAAAGGAAA